MAYYYISLYDVFKVHGALIYALSLSDVVSDSGDEGIRTPDPLLARQVLSQLSYTPI